MPTKIRLQRRGKKGNPFYHIVIADGRAPRDGKFIESIGTYNPLTSPATILLDAEKALKWVQTGAVPTDTCRAILSYEGILYKNHLLKGVTKGALTLDQVEEKFTAWKKDKQERLDKKIQEKNSKLTAEQKKKLEIESKIKEERAAAIAKQQSKLAQELAEAEANTTEETPAETPAEETPQAE
ncbi:MAG: 30S ribosomal protein S16 [Bacteroidota bacterium]|nr:30S ribosomal protein S16 [Bacteroidota bacterium]